MDGLQVAEQQGKYLAQMLNRQAKEPGWKPDAEFVFRSLGSMASVGGNSAILSFEVVTGADHDQLAVSQLVS